MSRITGERKPDLIQKFLVKKSIGEIISFASLREIVAVNIKGLVVILYGHDCLSIDEEGQIVKRNETPGAVVCRVCKYNRTRMTCFIRNPKQ